VIHSEVDEDVVDGDASDYNEDAEVIPGQNLELSFNSNRPRNIQLTDLETPEKKPIQ